MTLKLWLPIGSLLLALGPLAFAVIQVSSSSQAAFEAGFEARVRDTEAAIEGRIESLGAEIGRALERIAADPVVAHELLEPLARGRFYDDRRFDYERAMVREARRLMAAGVLDTLRIVDLGRDAHVIAMGHRTGLEPRDGLLAEVVSEGDTGAVFFRYERLDDPETGGMRAIWTLQVVRVVRAGEGRVAFAGGRELDRRLAHELRTLAGQGAHVTLEDGAGRRVAGTFDGPLPPEAEGGYAEADRELRNPVRGEGGERVGRWRVHVPRSELVARNAALWDSALIAALTIGGVAVGLALLLSLVLSRGFGTLSAAARDIASGARDGEVSVRGPRELKGLAIAFNRMTKALKASEDRLRQSERLAAWRDLARRIAHEIKNPLSPIQLSIETLQRLWDRKHPEFERVLRASTTTILEEVARMERIVTEFSNFARMAAPRPQRVDVGAISAQVVGLVASAGGPVELVAEAGEGELVAEVDPDQLRQVIHNLVKNAVEACGVRVGGAVAPRVEVWTTGEGEEVRVCVKDSGPGMDAATQAQLFTPYFTTKEEGTGLGLSIVRRIIDEHGGRIEVRSEVGAGTEVSVWLGRRWRAAAGGSAPG